MFFFFLFSLVAFFWVLFVARHFFPFFFSFSIQFGLFLLPKNFFFLRTNPSAQIPSTFCSFNCKWLSIKQQRLRWKQTVGISVEHYYKIWLASGIALLTRKLLFFDVLPDRDSFGCSSFRSSNTRYFELVIYQCSIKSYKYLYSSCKQKSSRIHCILLWLYVFFPPVVKRLLFFQIIS